MIDEAGFVVGSVLVYLLVIVGGFTALAIIAEALEQRWPRDGK